LPKDKRRKDQKDESDRITAALGPAMKRKKERGKRGKDVVSKVVMRILLVGH